MGLLEGKRALVTGGTTGLGLAGRIGQASDVAAAAVFYASDEAGFITGTTLLVDGGMTAGYLQRERNAQ